jgi:hypothetical protein
VYQIPSSLTIPVSTTLTIAACSRVELSPEVTVTVNGSLVVAGTASNLVSFVAASAGQPWGSIVLNPGGTADLSYATLTGGGGSTPMATSDWLGAPIYVHGGGGPPTPTPLSVSHVDVEGSTGLGIALINAGFAAGSTDLTVRGSGSRAVYLGADVLDSLPTGVYTGNAVDAIALQTAFYAGQSNERTITSDLTIHNRGVPYDVGLQDSGEIIIAGPSGGPYPLVTIEPGVTIRFCKGSSAGGRLTVQGGGLPITAYGALSAVGTVSQTIVFTSCEAVPQPGDWVGLGFVGVDPRSQLEYAVISDAGANSGAEGVCVTVNNGFDADAAIQIESTRSPPASFLTNCSILDSAASGIYRGWNVDDLDFLATNTLSGIAWCSETLVPDDHNLCPKTSCPTAP